MSTPAASNRPNGLLIVCGILLGVAGFFVGRLSVRVHDDGVTSSNAAVITVTNVIIPDGAITVLPPKVTEKPVGETSTAWEEKKWDELESQPGSPARNAALAAMLEKLATAKPDQAMKLAAAESNLKLHESLLQAALHGWARTAPSNAANWALALPDSDDRERALSTVFAGAIATNPDATVELGKSFIQPLMSQDPAEAAQYGNRMIDALCDAGNFEAAAKMAGSDQDSSSRWMAEAYSKWAEFQPEQAAQAAAALSDPVLRSQALHGIVGGWAEANPEALVQFVTQLPPDSENESLMSQSLQRWAKIDPDAASAWINKKESSPAMDAGVASVATMDSLKPEVAIGWAESVVDPKLRSETTVTVLRNWLTTDLTAAKNYFDTTKNLLPADREEVAGVIAALSAPSSPQ